MSSISFPLYNTLLKNLQQKELTKTQQKDMISKIDAMSSDKHELIYMLIYIFFNEHCNNICDKCDKLIEKCSCAATLPSIQSSIPSIPFNASQINNNLQFDISVFPSKLKKILFHFVQKNDSVIL